MLGTFWNKQYLKCCPPSFRHCELCPDLRQVPIDENISVRKSFASFSSTTVLFVFVLDFFLRVFGCSLVCRNQDDIDIFQPHVVAAASKGGRAAMETFWDELLRDDTRHTSQDWGNALDTKPIHGCLARWEALDDPKRRNAETDRRSNAKQSKPERYLLAGSLGGRLCWSRTSTLLSNAFGVLFKDATKYQGRKTHR